ncbi:hypothetical protein ZOSMA_181G00400 [Zostera marina]|uniref:Uncharacterized protein n=1 Tax=Zostera marina TaxID=29655 RepID=A0A0K9PT34_ZOSMR|nr:hypothetical protein ZOSMA_181G00400 [Zostera marina]
MKIVLNQNGAEDGDDDRRERTTTRPVEDRRRIRGSRTAILEKKTELESFLFLFQFSSITLNWIFGLLDLLDPIPPIRILIFHIPLQDRR